jgi:ribosome biogenesis GTPase
MPRCSHSEESCRLNEWAAPHGTVDVARMRRLQSLRSLLEIKDFDSSADAITPE